ncbi:dihydrofolate reductase family protein [Kribbella sancticallisti]|uniref:Dihydrofolate reductase family protein n=1 Tax=Kribbella sancticallisti TaxID=460087 RepID=A0ABN2EJ47_9ACTN
MSAVVVDITMSLDGYVTGPAAGPGNGLGDGGEGLHDWVMKGSTEDRAVLERSFEQTGAVIMGRNLFDVVDGPGGWNEEMGYGAKPDGESQAPIFVLTHQPPAKTRLGDRFRFVTDGPESALAQAQEVAGSKEIVVMGGGETCYEYLAAGLADVLRLHVAPVVLGGGTRLFPAEPGTTVPLEFTEVVSTPGAQHLTYKVAKK